MKTFNWIMICLLAVGVTLAGCGKKEQPKAMVVQGGSIDVPKLKEAFASGGADIQTSLSEITMGIRYADFPRVFAALAKLDSTPGVTEAQKKVIGEITEQVKQVAAKSAPAPGQ